MKKTNEEYNDHQKTKYYERKRKAKIEKNILTGIIIIIAILFFWYANDSRRTNASTADTIQGVRDELKLLRDQTTKQFDKIDKQFLEQDKKVESVKTIKAAQKQKQSVIKVAVKRPVGRGNCEQYRPLIAKYSWNVNTMVAICNAESGGNPNAANWTDNHGVCKGSFGLFQISCHGGQIFDPTANVAAAWGKYAARGYSPWSVCKNGTLRCV